MFNVFYFLYNCFVIKRKKKLFSNKTVFLKKNKPNNFKQGCVLLCVLLSEEEENEGKRKRRENF